MGFPSLPAAFQCVLSSFCCIHRLVSCSLTLERSRENDLQLCPYLHSGWYRPCPLFAVAHVFYIPSFVLCQIDTAIPHASFLLDLYFSKTVTQLGIIFQKKTQDQNPSHSKCPWKSWLIYQSIKIGLVHLPANKRVIDHWWVVWWLNLSFDLFSWLIICFRLYPK